MLKILSPPYPSPFFISLEGRGKQVLDRGLYDIMKTDMLKNKKITLDNLAGMMKREFDGLEERFVTKTEFKEGLRQMKEEIKEETRSGVDKLLIKADKILKKLEDKEIEEAAGLALYKSSNLVK